MSKDEFDTLCATRNLKMSIQAGAGSKKSIAQEITTDKDEKKKNKYRNEKTYVYPNGIVSPQKDDKLGKILHVFDSKKEYQRWEELKTMEKYGLIHSLEKQVPILIQEECVRFGEKIRKIEYKADFKYVNAQGETIIEDVKGYDKDNQKYITTKDFLLKWKLLKFKYPDLIFKIY